MPQRDEAAGFREQQEENAIHDRQRLLERVVEWLTRMAPASRRPKERAEHVGRRGKDALAQRSGDGRRMKVGRLDDRVQRRAIAAGRGRKCRRVQQRPERGTRPLVVDREIDVELEESPRIQPAGVDEPKVGAVEDQRPRGGPPHRLGHRDAPERIEAVAPRRHQQNNRMSAGTDRRNQDRIQPLDRRRSFEGQDLDQRGGGRFQQRVDAGRRTQPVAGAAPAGQACADVGVAAPPRIPQPARRGCENRSGRRQLTLEEEPGNEMPAQTWQHGLRQEDEQPGAAFVR